MSAQEVMLLFQSLMMIKGRKQPIEPHILNADRTETLLEKVERLIDECNTVLYGKQLTFDFEQKDKPKGSKNMG